MNRSVAVYLRRGPAAAALGALALAVMASLPAHASAPAPASGAGPTAATTAGPVVTPGLALRVRRVNAALQPPVASVYVEVAPPAPPVPPQPAALSPRHSQRTHPKAWVIGTVRGSANGFYYGQCTWWVAHRRHIPWRGNAWEWWWAARSYGFAEGQRPRVGSIMVMGYGWSSLWGHVAYVEAVYSNGSFLVSEMNWWGVPGGGWGRVDYRVVTSMRGVLGFIY